MKTSVKLLSLLICIILALLSLAGCKKKDSLITDEENLLSSYSPSSSVPSYNFRESADLMPENYSIYIGASQDFSLNLLRETAGKGENTVLSPLGASELLALLSNGSVSQTSQALKKAVASNLSLSDLNLCNHYLRQRINSISAEGSFFCTNSLWLNNRFDVKSSFLQTAVDYFGTGVIRTDFDGDKFYDKVNGYVGEKTDGKKQGEVQGISSDEMMFAVSDAFAFDSWVRPIGKDSLYKGSFTGTTDTTEEIFMTTSESYISSEIAEGFIKNLKNTPLRFAAVMPKEDMPLHEFLELLTSGRLSTLLQSETPTGKVSVALPAFSAETDTSLKDSLCALGAERAFSQESANFTDLSGSGKVYLGDLLHFSSIAVSPDGITQSMGEYSADKTGFDCDLVFSRPFVFVIYDNESNIPVFIGTVENNP